MGMWRASPTLSVHNIFLMQPMQVISSTIPTNTTINMPEAAPKGRGRPKGVKGTPKVLKPEAPATHTMKTRGK